VYSSEDKKATPLIEDPGNQSNAFASPDGHWLAYQSDETGRFEIYMQPFPPTGGKFQITTQGGQHPLWSLDGKELFYENAGHLMSVAIHTQPTFTFGNPTPMPLPQIVQAQGNQPRQYGLMPDGQQFIVKIPPASAKGPPPAPQIQVVLNWFEELKQRSKTK
jgi:Tol biopolymer transport system component